MSWDCIEAKDKSDVVRLLVKERKPLAHELVGDALWTLIDTEVDGIQIVCFSLALFDNGEWAFNEIPESVGPRAVNCPIGFLKLARRRCSTWRAAVRAFHRRPTT